MSDNTKELSQFAKMEEEVLGFWQNSKTFEKSVEREAPQGDYVFYDGPPFATGTPHYGHIVGSLMKDAVPRYFTMKGYRVERKWGWDCHGLPIENIAEKELGFEKKKDILEYGVDKFNELCRSKVLAYAEEWEKIIPRLGRWADMKNSYHTMDLPYMESIWWVFKELWDRDLIYEGYRSIHICPRCETTLSQSEVTEGYRDVKDLSAIAKFELLDEVLPTSPQPSPSKGEGAKTYVLAWTTTPWTLIGNVALAVGKDIDYVLVDMDKQSVDLKGKYIVAKERMIVLEENVKKINPDRPFEVEEIFKGTDLVGKKYKPLFDYYYNNEKLENRENGWQVYAGDFVTTEDGVGVVHIAPAFGEDDLNLGKENKLPFVQHVGMDGVIKPEAGEFAGRHVKPKDDVMATDVEIIKYLAHNGLLFHKEKYEHSYPHCWRCDTPLLNYVTSSWFVSVSKVKDQALELAKEINWSPAHMKEGRFGNWLAGARDWSISRQRFWASVMPIWRCAGQDTNSKKQETNSSGCGHRVVFGSVAELEQTSGEKIADLHKHIVDKVTFKCEQCSGVMKRVPDVLDTWFDSGSMPYAQMHYPFENREKFEANFPAEFIAEGVDQTRAWFYYLHILGTAIKGKPAFKNVIVNGIVLAEDGKKMAKRLQNYPDPSLMFDRYCADAMRCYLLSSSVMQSESLNFSESGVAEAMRKNIMILWNVYKFYEQYAFNLSSRESDSERGDLGLKSNESVQVSSNQPEIATPGSESGAKGQNSARNDSNNVLDKWIMARLNQLIAEVTKNMDAYDLPRSVRPISDFINDLSTWYIRRSRERFKSEDEADKQAALATTKFVLVELAKVMAPFMPFLAEQLWQKVTGHDFKDEDRSVHLEKWPGQETREQENKRTRVLEEMELVRKFVELSLARRDELGIKVRQPLSKLKIYNTKAALSVDYKNIIKDEVNVVEVEFIEEQFEQKVELITEMTKELIMEGIKRELVRFINNLRKDAGLTIQDRVDVYWQTEAEEVRQALTGMNEAIRKDTLSDELIEGEASESLITKEVKVNGQAVKLGLAKT